MLLVFYEFTPQRIGPGVLAFARFHFKEVEAGAMLQVSGLCIFLDFQFLREIIMVQSLESLP